MGVYHWTHYLEESEVENIRSHGFRTLYIRLFDVKWNTVYGAYPEAKSEIDPREFRDSIQWVPVVYISNSALINTPEDSIPALAGKIGMEIRHRLELAGLEDHAREWQFDCDWTERSREKYFTLLGSMREYTSLPLSATVKMYQYAYREKAGIPPTDRAVLMCYNLENPKDTGTENSIFSADEAIKYLKKKRYPLPLDIALPCFSWGILYRDNHFQGIENGLDEETIRYYPLKKIGDNLYEFTRNYDSWDVFYRKGDKLRLEWAGPEELEPLCDELKEHLNSDSCHIIFYHMNAPLFAKYEKDTVTFPSFMARFSQ